MSQESKDKHTPPLSARNMGNNNGSNVLGDRYGRDLSVI